MANLHISISAEPIAYIGQFPLSNSIFTSLIASTILITLALLAHKKLQPKRPSGLQNFLEIIVDTFYKLVDDITQSKAKTNFIFPISTTLFLFILLNNWLGLLPGVGTIGITHEPEPSVEQHVLVSDVAALEHDQEALFEDQDAYDQDAYDQEFTVQEEAAVEDQAKFIPIFRAGSADLNTTLALAIFSMVSVQVIGIKHLGLGYFKKFFDLKNPINGFVGLLELVSEFAKVISFAFRLFGNIFAGEVLLAVIAFLIPVIAPVPFLALEVFVGLIQALVFAMLSIVFMTMATQAHGADH